MKRRPHIELQPAPAASTFFGRARTSIRMSRKSMQQTDRFNFLLNLLSSFFQSLLQLSYLSIHLFPYNTAIVPSATLTLYTLALPYCRLNPLSLSYSLTRRSSPCCRAQPPALPRTHKASRSCAASATAVKALSGSAGAWRSAHCVPYGFRAISGWPTLQSPRMPASLSSLANRSCSVPNIRSERPRASGE